MVCSIAHRGQTRSCRRQVLSTDAKLRTSSSPQQIPEMEAVQFVGTGQVQPLQLVREEVIELSLIDERGLHQRDVFGEVSEVVQQPVRWRLRGRVQEPVDMIIAHIGPIRIYQRGVDLPAKGRDIDVEYVGPEKSDLGSHSSDGRIPPCFELSFNINLHREYVRRRSCQRDGRESAARAGLQDDLALESVGDMGRETRVDSHCEGTVAGVVVRAELGLYGIFVHHGRLNLGWRLESKSHFGDTEPCSLRRRQIRSAVVVPVSGVVGPEECNTMEAASRQLVSQVVFGKVCLPWLSKRSRTLG